jgi:hypothetical protein
MILTDFILTSFSVACSLDREVALEEMANVPISVVPLYEARVWVVGPEYLSTACDRQLEPTLPILLLLDIPFDHANPLIAGKHPIQTVEVESARIQESLIESLRCRIPSGILR